MQFNQLKNYVIIIIFFLFSIVFFKIPMVYSGIIEDKKYNKKKDEDLKFKDHKAQEAKDDNWEYKEDKTQEDWKHKEKSREKRLWEKKTLKEIYLEKETKIHLNASQKEQILNKIDKVKPANNIKRDMLVNQLQSNDY